jgi:hypothetical protein
LLSKKANRGSSFIWWKSWTKENTIDPRERFTRLLQAWSPLSVPWKNIHVAAGSRARLFSLRESMGNLWLIGARHHMLLSSECKRN